MLVLHSWPKPSLHTALSPLHCPFVLRWVWPHWFLSHGARRAECRMHKGASLNLSFKSQTIVELSWAWRSICVLNATQSLLPVGGQYTKWGYKSTSGYNEPEWLSPQIIWVQSWLNSLHKLSSCLDNYAEFMYSFNKYHRIMEWLLCVRCCNEGLGTHWWTEHYGFHNIGLWLLNYPWLEPAKGLSQHSLTHLDLSWRWVSWIEEKARMRWACCRWVLISTELIGDNGLDSQAFSALQPLSCTHTSWHAYRSCSSVFHSFYPQTKDPMPFPCCAGLLLSIYKSELLSSSLSDYLLLSVPLAAL